MPKRFFASSTSIRMRSRTPAEGLSECKETAPYTGRSNTSIQGGMRDRGRTWLKHASCQDWSHPPWSPFPSQQRMRELGTGQSRPDISLCDVGRTCSAGEQGGAIRCGVGGAKGGDQGKCEPAKHAPDSEPGTLSRKSVRTVRRSLISDARKLW